MGGELSHGRVRGRAVTYSLYEPMIGHRILLSRSSVTHRGRAREKHRHKNAGPMSIWDCRLKSGASENAKRSSPEAVSHQTSMRASMRHVKGVMLIASRLICALSGACVCGGCAVCGCGCVLDAADPEAAAAVAGCCGCDGDGNKSAMSFRA